MGPYFIEQEEATEVQEVDLGELGSCGCGLRHVSYLCPSHSSLPPDTLR